MYIMTLAVPRFYDYFLVTSHVYLKTRKDFTISISGGGCVVVFERCESDRNFKHQGYSNLVIPRVVCTDTINCTK